MIRCVALALVLVLAAPVAACGDASMAFDKAGWAMGRGDYEGENPRATMVAGLDEAGVRPGARRDEVRALLGEPDSTGPEADIYYLGRSRSGPSFETYRIDYAPDGTVTATALRRS